MPPQNLRPPTSDPRSAPPSSQTDGRARRRRAGAILVAVACGLTLGIGLTVALTGSGGGGDTDRPDESATPTTPTDSDDAPAPPGAGAATPVAAVQGFLDAEIDGDLDASYGFLSADARSRFGSPAGWVAAHADILAPVDGYEVQETSEPSDGDDQAEVVTTVRFEPGLDEVRGLVAERAVVTWATAAEDGGSWGIDLDATTLDPLYPPDDAAPEAVAAWAEAHQACAPARTWEGNLRGSPSLAERLCGADGAVEVGPALPLTIVDSGPFLAAFGPEVGDWARVVAVTAPVELRAVVAPIGQEWLVIGVLPA